MKVYFDPLKYPTVTDKNDLGFVNLHKDLEVLALADGFYMKYNGHSKCSKSCLCCCRCNNAYIPSKEEERGPFRILSLHYDALNSRGSDGRPLSWWTKSMMPFEGEDFCYFCFYVKWDSIGIYLHCGTGSSLHNSHPKIINDDMLLSSQLISNAEQDVLRKLGQSYTNCCIGRNYMFRTTGQFITRSQIRRL